MFYEEFSSVDRKILAWDKECLDDLVGCFTEKEYSEMERYLNSHPCFPIKEKYDGDIGCLVFDYMRYRVHQQIADGIIKGAREFFDALMEWYKEDVYIPSPKPFPLL